MFVRTKKIGGKHYAYLVENRWESGRAKQTVAQYLGRVHDVPRLSNAAPALSATTYAQMIELLITNELSNHGFEKRENTLVRDNIVVNAADWTVQNKGKPAVLKINDGFFCSHTVRQLMTYAPADSNGFMLARRLVEAGLAVPKDTFVALFEKTGVKQ